MGIFDKIKDAIWGSDEPSKHNDTVAMGTQPKTASTAGTPSATPSSMPGSVPPNTAPKPAAPNSPTAAPTPAAPTPTSAAPGTAPSAKPGMSGVDVEKKLDAAVAAKGQKLDWRHSIVDLMKALDLDSSLENRKELAKELNYTGDTSDSANMNIWLHKALMKKLAENGGTVPAGLAD